MLETPVLAPIETQLWTLSTWVKWNNLTGSNEAIFSTRQNGLASSTGFDLYITDSGAKLRARTYKGNGIGAEIEIVLATYGITTGVWYNIVCIYNSGTLSVSINDGAVFSGSASGNYTASGVNPTIGKWRNGSGYHDGNIDEVAIWGTDETANISTISTSPVVDLTSLSPIVWLRNGDNGTWKSPQWLIPNNENKTKFSNYSFEYDGVDDYVNSGASTLSGETALTISAWVYPTSYGDATAPSFVSTDASSPRAFYLGLFNGTNFRFSLSTNGTSLTSLDTASSTVTLNAWQHILVTWDQINLKLYKNGVLLKTVATTSSSNGTFTTTNDLLIGARRSSAGFFEGNIDEVAVFNSVQDASTIYNSGVPSDLSSLSPVGYWRSEQSYFTDNWLVDNSALSNYSTRSFSFDGIGDYIDVGNDVSLNLTSQITCSAWVKFEGLNNSVYYGIISNFNPSSGRKFTFIYYPATSAGSRKLRVRINSSSNILSSYFDTVVDLSDDQWHHLAFTFDGTTNSNGLNVYVDGVNLNSFTAPNAGIYSSSGDTLIGSYLTSSWFMNGNIDEVAVFPSALSGTDITSLYNSGEPARIEGAVSHWRMGEDATFNTNWNVPDNVGSNNGTSANMTISDLEGNAPNYTGGGLSNNMTIEDRVGDASNSTSNALSLNMDEADRETDVPT